jgi:hypothetical protein
MDAATSAPIVDRKKQAIEIQEVTKTRQVRVDD